MPKRRADYASRKFFDEFQSVRISRLRAMGVVNPAKDHAVIPFPNGKNKLLNVQHTHLRNGGGWSYFVCPKCRKRAVKLYLIDDAPLCRHCCDKLNIQHRTRYGFGRDERARACDQKLDELIAKLGTSEPIRFNPMPPVWRGAAQRLCNSRNLTARMRRRMIALRLALIASRQAHEGQLKLTRGFAPRKDALELIPDLANVWRANTTERLEQALDKAQVAVLNALSSDNAQHRQIAASLLLRSKPARALGF